MTYNSKNISIKSEDSQSSKPIIINKTHISILIDNIQKCQLIIHNWRLCQPFEWKILFKITISNSQEKVSEPQSMKNVFKLIWLRMAFSIIIENPLTIKLKFLIMEQKGLCLYHNEQRRKINMRTSQKFLNQLRKALEMGQKNQSRNCCGTKTDYLFYKRNFKAFE